MKITGYGINVLYVVRGIKCYCFVCHIDHIWQWLTLNKGLETSYIMGVPLM